jgi:hypothetical protein
MAMQLLRKVSSFIWRGIKITVLVLLILLIGLFFLLQVPKVQTYLGKEASSYLSKKLKTKIDIKVVNIDFLKTINLEGVYIEDLHHDTLLYGGKIGCAIKFYSFKTRQLEIDVTELDNITCKLIYYKGAKDLNFQFIADYFSAPTAKKDTTTKPSAEFKLGYGNLKLSNVRFVYKDLDYSDVPKYGIDFEDIEVSNIYANFSNIAFAGDSVKVKINDLTAVEKSGIRIKKLSTEATLSPKGIKAEKLLLITNNSYVHGSYSMLTDSFADYNDYIHAVDMRANFTDSTYIDFADIAYFAEELEGLHEKVKINGYVKGSVDNLSSDNLSFSLLKHTSFSGHVIIKGLPNLDTTFMAINAKHFTTNYFDLKQIPSYPFKKKETIEIPVNIAKLGTISFTGKGEGFASDLLVEGNLKTALGSLSAYATLSQTANKEFKYGGTFKTDKFNIGKFLDANNIGEISLDAKINGSGSELNTLQEDINGTVKSFQFNGYTYHNITVNGNVKNKQFAGNLSAKDTNATFDFTGKIDFTKKIPQAEFAADIKKIDLYKCNFYKVDTIDLVSGNVEISISGNTVDDVSGTLRADKIQFIKSNGLVTLKNTDIILIQNEVQNSLQMISSVADADVNGKFKLTTLPKSVGNFLENYFPIFFPADNKNKKNKPNTDKLSFKIRVKDINPVAKFFKIPLQISNGSMVQGTFNAESNKLTVSGLSDKIDYNKIPIKDWFLTISTTNNQVYFNTGFKRVDLADSIYIGNFNFETHSINNKSDFLLTWDNNSQRKNSGEIDGKLLFTKSTLDLDLGKFLIYAEDSLWQMTGNDEIAMDSSGTVNFHDLVFANNNQQVKLEGKISKDPKEQLLINFQNFKLNQLNPLVKRDGVDLQGILTGTANFSDLYNQFVFTTALEFKKLIVNSTPIGAGEINSFFDKNKNLVSLNGFFKRDFGKISENTYNNIRFDGYYYPSIKDTSIDIDLHLFQFAVSAIQPLVKDIFTIDKGTVTGNINIKGNLNKPAISGTLELEDVTNFKIDYTNTVYEAKGKINLYPGQIEFQNIILTDAYRNTATIWGDIFHDNFSNMKLDFDINTKKFMALNTTALQNSTFYGKAFCTGSIGLYGPVNVLTFDVNAKTDKGTQFIIPLAGPGEVSENGYIRFVKIDSANKNNTAKNDASGIKLNLNLEATPDAEVQIILDDKGGDAIKARGRGNISMNINTNGNFDMYGIYTITEGSYLFTLQNVINKKFDIDEGSTIRWSGNPYDADINIAATYKQRTSLAPFFPEQTNESGSSSASGGSSSKRYPVSCKLYLKNKLMNPDITFGIELPTVSEVIRSQVMGYINNDQELNRQVFSLLLLGSFVTPLQLQSVSGVAGNASAGNAATSNATEMLSNQLNGMLSKFTKAFNLGFNYRPSSALSNEEIDVALSTQLFNDKLTIDGNIGVNNNAQQKTSTLIGDLNVDYKLTKDGKVHVKAFNRSNDNFQIATLGGQFTQGAGILYREEFNSMADFFRRMLTKKPKMTKQ